MSNKELIVKLDHRGGLPRKKFHPTICLLAKVKCGALFKQLCKATGPALWHLLVREGAKT